MAATAATTARCRLAAGAGWWQWRNRWCSSQTASPNQANWRGPNSCSGGEGARSRSQAVEKGCEAGSGGFELANGGIEIGLEMEEALEANQLDGLNDAGIAHDQEAAAVGLEILGQLHQGPEA